MATTILSIAIVGIAFTLIGVRNIFIKGGEFRGTCSSNNPLLKEKGVDCPICGAKSGEECKE